MSLFFESLANSVALMGSPTVLLVVLAGVLWGSAAAALPGMSSVVAIGIMLPFTFGLDPVHAVACLVAVNVGVAYGNSIPAILMGLPGTPGAVLTAIDGYALHRQGKSGLALGITYIASVTGQFFSGLFFLAMVVPLSALTYVFLAPELFALYFLGIVTLIAMTSENILKGLLSVAFGLVIAMVGRDPMSAVGRFDFGLPALRTGIDTVPVVLGLLAVSEIFRSMRQSFKWESHTASFSPEFPTLKDIRRSAPSILGGTVIGSLVGAIPGVSGTAAAVISYQQSKLWSDHPEEYGKGSIDGIAANEAAQSASQAGEMVPAFGLGIPSGGAMVMLLGSLLMHGFIPGPLLIKEAPELLYATVCGLLAASIMLAIIGWPIARMLLRVVTLDRSVVLCCALLLTMLGTYISHHIQFDVVLLVVFGFVGYFMLRYGYSTAGAAMAVVLGGGLETNLRSGLLLVGDVWTFVSRPWTALILGMALILLAHGTIGTIRLSRRAALRRNSAAEECL